MRYRSSEFASRSLPLALDTRRLKSLSKLNHSCRSTFDGRTFLMSLDPMAPSRRTWMPNLVCFTTVDSRPIEVMPPFKTRSTLPLNTLNASSALISDRLPEIFALVPRRDPPAFEIKSNVSPRSGILRPTIFSRPVTWRSEEHTSELQSPYDLVC